VLFALAIAD
jgi:hypothetical protein